MVDVGGLGGMTIDLNEVEARVIADVSAAVEASNFAHAFELANMAINRGMRHRVLFNARGLALQAVDRHQEALEDFRRALTLAPNDQTIFNAIGLCLSALERYPEAIRSFDAAIAIQPNNPHSHCRKGLTLAAAGDHDAAQAAYERAIEIDPDHPKALANLASIAARKRKTEQARAFASRALKLEPNEPTAIYALAILEIAEKRFPEAEQRLRTLLAQGKLNLQARAGVLGLLGDALDGQKRYSEAFATYVMENKELRGPSARRFSDGRAADAARHLIAYFESTPAERWRAPDDGGSIPDGPAEHVFLLGFMRSGTTLLEQVLASHPQIVALEEKGTLNGLGQTYMTSYQALDSLAMLKGAELAGTRQFYWNRVRSHRLDLSGKIFVDKQPLNTVKLPLIAKLFPKAKILFALRDPRDVVFSCFRRHFKINVTMFEFMALDDAARFYTSIMRLAELYRQKLPLNLLEHRYEDMVEDFDARVRAVCDFIGIEWTAAMRSFDKNAPTVDLRSPSATQVLHPLYSGGIGQWRRYEKELAPILPILQPWVDKFGYPPD